MLKRVLLLVFALFNGELFAYTPVSSAILVDAKDGRVIYSYNANVQTQPASLTKMMTLLLTFKFMRCGKISPNAMITVSTNAAAQAPCSLGLRAGSQISVKNAIFALIVKSANDVSVALAEHISGTEAKFVAMMNKEAQSLGMYSTRFVNSSGWKNSRQLTTAIDMAKLARALLIKSPTYYHLFATKQFYFNNKRIKNHNALLWKKSDIEIDGIKTGFVNASGFNLAASATNGKNRLIAVVFGGKSGAHRDAQAYLLLKKGFERLEKIKSNKVVNSKSMTSKQISRKPSGLYKKIAGDA